MSNRSAASLYQVGGSLPSRSPTYVDRQADETLLKALMAGQFCYVFNSRQMGKSSLRVRTLSRLKDQGIQGVTIDLNMIGSQQVTAEQWYGAIAASLVRGFQLSIAISQWWRQEQHLSPVSRLGNLIETVLLTEIATPIVILIDEIDSVLSLKFPTDDFFALIRACFDRRADSPAYERLTFALFGVTTPGELITDKQRTPFNIGQAIPLKGFTLEEAQPLAQGLAHRFQDPLLALHQILYWTNGHPFLTQKLCYLMAETQNFSLTVPLKESTVWVDDMVQKMMLADWELQDEPEHLCTIRDRLWHYPDRMGQVLGLYGQVLLSEQAASNANAIVSDDSAAHVELRLLGLVETRHGYLRVHNRIYQTVFNLNWIREQLDHIRPYATALNVWALSNFQDTSSLLRGSVLQKALEWSQHQTLSDVDYRFLAASQSIDRQETLEHLEAMRLKEVEARLQLERARNQEQRRNLQRQRILLGAVTLALLGAIAAGLVAGRQVHQTALGEIRALNRSAEAFFASHQTFEALIEAMRSQHRIQRLGHVDPELQTQADNILERTLLNAQQKNHLQGHTAAVLTAAFSPDGQFLATAGVDNTIRIWNQQGKLLNTLTGHPATIRAVKYSLDGQQLVSIGDNGSVFIWNAEGEMQRELKLADNLWALDFSPDGRQFVVGGSAQKLTFLNLQGEEQGIVDLSKRSFSIRAIAYHPQGEYLAVTGSDGALALVGLDGELRHYDTPHQGFVQTVAFSPDGELMISGAFDKTIKLWTATGKLIRTLEHHQGNVQTLVFTADSRHFVSGSWDKSLALWDRQGVLLDTFQGHQAAVWGAAISPDNMTLASAGADNNVLLWQLQSPYRKNYLQGLGSTALGAVYSQDGKTLAIAGNSRTITLLSIPDNHIKILEGHTTNVTNVTRHPTQNWLTSTSEDTTIKLWQFTGELIRTLRGHTSVILSASWHPNGTELISSNTQGLIFRWNAQGQILQRWQAHPAPIWDVAYRPDGKQIVSAGNDGTVRLWSPNGQQQNILNHKAAVWRVTYSPDGELLASGSGDMTAKIWRTDGTLVKTLQGHQAAVWGVDFSPDGKLLATASIDETVKLWTREGELLLTLTSGNSGIRSTLFSPDGQTLTAISDDGFLVQWNVPEILGIRLQRDACRWLSDYLETNAATTDQNLCQGF